MFHKNKKKHTAYCTIEVFSKIRKFLPEPDVHKYMNEWWIYIALFCVLLYTTKRFTIMWGGLSSTTTSVQHPLGWCDGCHSTTAPVRSPHTSYRWRNIFLNDKPDPRQTRWNHTRVRPERKRHWRVHSLLPRIGPEKSRGPADWFGRCFIAFIQFIYLLDYYFFFLPAWWLSIVTK